MELDDPPITQGEADLLTTLAYKVALYRQTLADQGVNDELADQLVRDWHMGQLQQRAVRERLPDGMQVMVLS